MNDDLDLRAFFKVGVAKPMMICGVQFCRDKIATRGYIHRESVHQPTA